MTNTANKSAQVIYSHTGLRGLAALYVVVFHTLLTDKFPEKNAFHYFFSFGVYSVDLFFILSGFILNWVYGGKRAQINWPSYLWARAARILPLYYLVSEKK